MDKYMTRMGDGSAVFMSLEEIRSDVRDGASDAARRGKIPPLTDSEIDHIVDIITMDGIVVGVRYGDQVVGSTDQGSDTVGAECGVSIDRIIQAQMYERGFGLDSSDFGFTDYNFKAVKSIASYEASYMERALDGTVIPLLYGGMPNLGFYTKPDGPVENWAELLPQAKIDEALAAQEQAVDLAVHDIVYVAEQMDAIGADGINLDTAGAAGDADFLATLLATEEIKKKFPNQGVEIGMAGEFVLGMHGKLTYKGERLAGLYPHKQVALAEQAGATVFGAVVNTNTSKSFPWNIARVCTFIKETVKEAGNIAVHANVGMGVGGIPMCEVIPCDAVSRADKALIEITNLDGL
jgi:dimethylamine--corrinoid protein Co-methyltransferase